MADELDELYRDPRRRAGLNSPPSLLTCRAAKRSMRTKCLESDLSVAPAKSKMRTRFLLFYTRVPEGSRMWPTWSWKAEN